MYLKENAFLAMHLDAFYANKYMQGQHLNVHKQKINFMYIATFLVRAIMLFTYYNAFSPKSNMKESWKSRFT